MTPARPIDQEAGFVSAAGGPRLRIVTQPSGHPLGTVIWIHAFADEMNKTRRMSARMTRLLAGQGWCVIQKDLFGCGDSAGDFADASWPMWVDDVDLEVRQADPGKPIWLWCVRAGALLAAAVLKRRPQVNLLLWHPVVSGAQHLQQFLRLHTGARVLGSTKSVAAPTPAQALRAGVVVEVGGYALSPPLADALGQAVFDVPPEFAGRIVWLELWPDEAPAVSLPSSRIAERLLGRGIDVQIAALLGPAFWQTVELEESELLLQSSLSALGTPAPAGNGAAMPLVVEKSGADPSPSRSAEQVLEFHCDGTRLRGVLCRPGSLLVERSTAVLIAVGGPQYRVGSHRQFVLLARRLAERGHASLRFDYRGMGDSEGEPRGFEDVRADLHAAVDALRDACPDHAVVVWGLCDAASAAMLHGGSHPAVSGIVAVNPWARSDTSLAAAQVKHYYLARMLERDFWAKLAEGRLDFRASAGALFGNLRRTWRHIWAMRSRRAADHSYQSRMARGLASFGGRVLLILAGNDLTAKEFLQHAAAAPAWRGLLDASRVSRVDVPLADHTFSSREWQRQLEDATIEWLQGAG